MFIESDDAQFAEVYKKRTEGGPRYQVHSRSAQAPKSGGGKYRHPVHIRVYDTHHPDYQGRGSGGAVEEWNNVDSRYGGHKSEHGKALLAAHSLAARLNQEHESSQHSEEAADDTELDAIYEGAQFAETKHREPVNKALASELMNVHSYVDQKGAVPNKYGFVGQQHGAIVKNLNAKKKRGVYDHEKAKKLFGYYAKSLSDHYVKEHGGTHANPATRAHVASMLADAYHHGTQHSEKPTENYHVTDEQAEAILQGSRFIRR